jgi:outer membrane PBP1 activator LpoA protein
MNKREPLSEQSKIRRLLILAEIALNENRYEEAVSILSGISPDEMATLSAEELQAIGRLLNYLKDLAEKKKDYLVEQLKIIQASKDYLS